MNTFLRCSEISSLSSLLQKPKDMGNFSNVMVVALAVICVVMPLDVSQLVFALVGAVAFSLVQSVSPKQKKHTNSSKRVCVVPTKNVASRPPQSQPRVEKARPVCHRSQPAVITNRPDVRKPSAAPVKAPTFESSEWDKQVAELLHQIAPSAEDDQIVGKLACFVKQAIKPMLPEVEVVGFASGDLTRKKAFGVAVPDVDVVANVNPVTLAERLGGRIGSFNDKFDPKKLQKSAIRACTDRLVSEGGFKFRRSAFRGEEPKVTLLAPASFGICNDAIPIDFSVNAVGPLHNAALLTECGQIEPRARELILLVKRWAKDRGICHAAKGHLSPYAWSLLCIFFLQAGMEDGESLLPALSGFKKASQLVARGSPDEKANEVAGSSKNTARLFCDFMAFYQETFGWKTEAVSIRSGVRGKPGLSLPLHIIVGEENATVVGPSIEDPFDESRNLASGMSAASLARLHEELQRARTMCSTGASLADLLEPWAPPEQDSSEHVSENGRDEDEPAKPPSVAPWRKRPSA